MRSLLKPWLSSAQEVVRGLRRRTADAGELGNPMRAAARQLEISLDDRRRKSNRGRNRRTGVDTESPHTSRRVSRGELLLGSFGRCSWGLGM